VSESSLPLAPGGGELHRLFPPLAGPAVGTGTYISRLVVEGFGALSGLEVADIGPGLNILLGPNEAGKSTLFDFMATMLFGFPTRRSDGRFHAPVHGGRHGGRLMLADKSGEEWTIERFGPPKKAFSLRRPDGTLGDELDLRPLLGGANGELFRAVFAVDLDDLRQLDGMSSDEVREVLFSSSVLGQRHSTARALRELEAAREDLVRPRQGGRANTLAAELRNIRAELAAARTAARQFSGIVSERDEVSARLLELDRHQEEALRRLRELELLETCWEVDNRRLALETELSKLPLLTGEEAILLDKKAVVESMASQLSGHLERLGSYRESLEGRLSLAKSVREKTAALGETALLLARAPSFDGDALRAELGTLRDDLVRAEGRRIQCEQAVAQERQQRQELLSEPEPCGSLAELDQRLSLLRELQSWLAEQDTTARELEQLAGRADRSRPVGSLSGPVSTALVVLGLLIAAAGVLLIAGHQGGLGAGLCVLAGLLAGVVAVLRSRAASPLALPELEESLKALKARLGKAAEKVSGLATELGLALPVSPVELQQAIATTERRRDERRAFENQLMLASAAARRLKTAEDALQVADEELARTRASLATFGERIGLRDAPVEQVTSFLERLIVLRDRDAALTRIDDQLVEAQQAIERFETSLSGLLEALGRSEAPAAGPDGHFEPDTLDAVLGLLANEVAQAEERLAARGKLASELKAAEAELLRLLGRGERAEALLSELGQGEVVDWREQAEERRSALRALKTERDEALRTEERLSGQIDELTASGRIPQLEQQALEIEAELRRTMEEYLVASGATLLLQQTLKRYEQERQPRVIELASRQFGRITEGRYVRLLIDTAPDGSKPTVEVFSPDGASVDASFLSRGTLEQLYLCLRLALAESFAEGYLPLPIVLDDVLVNADPLRREKMALALGDTATRHQVIFLTCHPDVAELLERSSPTRARLHELSRL
jgi:uncharacterized protein YhaN